VKLSEFVGTPLYQSPEQTQGLHYNQKVDIYAMGLILYEMCSSFKTGMERRESIDRLKNEHKINNEILEKYPLESSLILWMTNFKPADRPNAQEIIDSMIFKKLKTEQDNI
jgi:eukaryotic translation initiation factor 2-alpha kinase 4